MSGSKVAIIIINWNSFGFTNDCLNSLAEMDYEGAEIVLVDNCSADDSLSRLKAAHPQLHYVENDDNLGFSEGNNSGISYALAHGFDYLLLLNNDTFVASDFLSQLMKMMEENPDAGAVQPKIFYNHDRSLIWSAGGKFSNAFTRSWTIGNNKKDTGAYDQPREIDWVTGCAFLVRSSVVKEVGALSDLFFYGCYDDVEWSLRIRKAGHRLLYCPQSVVYHAVAASASGTKGKEGVLRPFFHYMVNRNHLILLRLHTSTIFMVTSYIYQIIKCGGNTAYFLLRNRPRKLKAALHGFFHGLTKPLDPKALQHKHYIQRYR